MDTSLARSSRSVDSSEPNHHVKNSFSVTKMVMHGTVGSLIAKTGLHDVARRRAFIHERCR
jgi:hypothetical protein